ncbi:MAG: SDR family NAD(P)-dependent oxidoreductase [Acidimicrobiaceae bacterium]|nr:SDR family NAD(P)-dependent oxidoreductase [Acidimicrobiaceae bacterium]MYH00423.1 SDR family NAD(P)-dependent oxidoreductase [Acidimicrobiaceae bacterium]MYH77663.1 SDR family NAD(P)-dependent oxidoreductase [Acidimicrobiaceae bacterium]
MDLAGAAAIVTGGASGIGRACANRLAGLGAHCVILDIQEAKGAEAAAEVGGVFVEGDVAEEVPVQAAVEVAGELGPLRVLVNSAGIASAVRTVDRHGQPMPLERFERVVATNLIGTFNCIRLAAAAMAGTEPVDDDGQRGAIVNMASVAAFDGQTGQNAYSASKGGVVGMTLPIARDLVPIGVRINTIAPGLINTPIYGTGPDAEAFKAHLAEGVLFPKRLGTADELASMVMELITNDYMNGEVIRVDAGIRLPPK